MNNFWRKYRLLILIVAAAALVRILATLTREMVNFDETAYLRIAQNLINGRGYINVSEIGSTQFAPLLPLMIAAFSLVIGDIVLSGYVVVIAFGSLLLVPLYLLARQLFDERIALMSAALMAVMPIFVGTSEYIYPEGIYIFFLLFAFFFGWRMLSERRALFGIAAGVSTAFAYLANPSGAFYVLALAFLAVLLAWRQRAWRSLALPTILMIGIFVLISLPYLVFLHGELGRWTFSGKATGGNIYAATHDIRRDDTHTWEKTMLSLGNDGEPLIISFMDKGDNPLNFVVGSPFLAAKTFMRQCESLYSKIVSQVFPLWLLPLLGLGLFAQGWTRYRALVFAFFAVMSAPILLVLAMYAHARFFMPFVPLAAITTAAGWSHLQDRLPGRKSAWMLAAAVLLPMLIFSAITAKRIPYDTQYKEAGTWLKANAGSGHRIMNREFASAYYADGVAVLLPYSDYSGVTSYAARKDVDFLIVTRSHVENYRPELRPMLESPASHPDWALIQTLHPGTAVETMIFERIK